MYLLEEEVVFNELLLNALVHAFKWVECTLQVVVEVFGGFDDEVHDRKSLLLADTWSEWEVSQVAADSDSSGDDHGCVFLGQLSASKTLRCHVGDVLVAWSVFVILLDDLIEELGPLLVGVVGSGIHADSRVQVFDT